MQIRFRAALLILSQQTGTPMLSVEVTLLLSVGLWKFSLLFPLGLFCSFRLVRLFINMIFLTPLQAPGFWASILLSLAPPGQMLGALLP